MSGLQDETRDPRYDLNKNEVEAIKVTQDIIKRMAENSQKTKTLFISICAGFYALLGAKLLAFNYKTMSVFLLVCVVLWCIDARYLQLERCFREHHKAIVGGIAPLDAWNFNPQRYKTSCLVCAMFSFPLLIYPILIICLTLLIA